MTHDSRILDIAATGIILIIAALVLLTAPTDGNFWWSDAPRHALNGVFVADLLRDLPLTDLKGYAYAYYAKHPALTILFYPPLFYLLSAPFYLILGVSHFTAQAVVGAHFFALGLGAFALARQYFDRFLSLILAVVLLCLPEVLLWGRQVMLEIPAFAFLTWSAVYLLRYCAMPALPWRFYLSLFLLLCAVWTKLSVVFVLPAYAVTIFAALGWAAMRNRHLYFAGLLFCIGLMPLAAITMMFGQANLQSVSSIADAVAPRWSVAGWTWYLLRLPEQMGWTVLGLTIAGLIFLIRYPRMLAAPKYLLLLVWLAVGYVFFSYIDLKEARHSVFLLLPLVLLAGSAFSVISDPRLRAAAAGGLAFGVAFYGIAITETPYYDGYRQAMDFVARSAPRDSTVVFSGKRDGSFIFNARARSDRADLAVVRADKLLLRVAVRRELGVEEKTFSEPEIAAMIGDAGAYYIVAQVDFWTDLQVMQRLQSVLRSEQFEEVARIEVGTNLPNEDRELRIYRNKGQVASPPKRMDLDLPIIGRTISGAQTSK